MSCLNPVIRLREDFYNLLLLQSKVKFKNFMQLSSYSISEQDLIKSDMLKVELIITNATNALHAYTSKKGIGSSDA